MINNNTCWLNVNTDGTEEHKRVLPFMNPKIVYNPTTKTYNFDTSACSIPKNATPYFNVDSGCIFKPKENIETPDAWSTQNELLEYLDNDQYPYGCGVNVTNKNKFNEQIKKLSYTFDASYFNEIASLRKQIAEKEKNILELQGSIEKKTKYTDILKKGLTEIQEKINYYKTETRKMTESDISAKYKHAKKTYISNRDIYMSNKKQLDDWIRVCNNLSHVILHEHCSYEGRKEVLRMDPSAASKNFDSLGSLNNQVSAIKVPPGMKFIMEGENNYKRAWVSIPHYVYGLQSYRSNDQGCLVNVNGTDVNDIGSIGYLERIAKFRNNIFRNLRPIDSIDENRMNADDLVIIDD